MKISLKHKDMIVRRKPVITIGITLVCFSLWMVFSAGFLREAPWIMHEGTKHYESLSEECQKFYNFVQSPEESLTSSMLPLPTTTTRQDEGPTVNPDFSDNYPRRNEGSGRESEQKNNGPVIYRKTNSQDHQYTPVRRPVWVKTWSTEKSKEQVKAEEDEAEVIEQIVKEKYKDVPYDQIEWHQPAPETVETDVEALIEQSTSLEEEEPLETYWTDRATKTAEKSQRLEAKMLSSMTYRYWNSAYHGDEPSLRQAVTASFLHRDLTHLITNLFFLWLFMPALENRHGRPFALLVFLIGAIATMLLGGLSTTLITTRVGSSGAIFTVLGACILAGRCFELEINRANKPATAYTIPFWSIGLFLVALPLVLAKFKISPIIELPGQGNPHWWGLALGFGLMKGVQAMGWETHLLLRKTEKARLDLALLLEKENKISEALKLIKADVLNNTFDTNLIEAYWRIAKTTGSTSEITLAGTKGLEYAIKKDLPYGVRVATELNERKLLDRLAPILVLKLAQSLRTNHLLVEAQALLTFLKPTEATWTAKTRETFNQEVDALEAKLAEQAPATSHSPETTTQEAPQATSQPTTEEVPIIPIPVRPPNSPLPPVVGEIPRARVALRVLAVIPAVPLSLENGQLIVDVKGNTRPLPLTQIKQLAVGAIYEPNKKPYLVMDLGLDAFDPPASPYRILRLQTNQFNPMTFVPNTPNLGAACREFTAILINSGNLLSLLPSVEAAMGKPYAQFTSLADFEKTLYPDATRN